MTRLRIGRRLHQAARHLRVLAGLLLATSAAAAEHPMLAAGFAPNTIQQGDRYGSVNVLNGALTLPIAIGPTYRLNEALSYGLSLTFSSTYRHWVSSPGPPVFQKVRGRSTVGWGWVMHMGRIGRSPGKLPIGSSGWAYQSPDGSWHELYFVNSTAQCGTLNPCYLTKDGSYIRAVYSTTAAPEPVPPDGAYWRLWTPDGVERETRHILAAG